MDLDKHDYEFSDVDANIMENKLLESQKTPKSLKRFGNLATEF